MSEHARSHSSVFAKLLAIMLTMAISLLLLVSGFFLFVLVPTLNSSVDALGEEYVHDFAASQPNFDEAKRISERLDLEVRYEGPDGTWSTSDELPPIAQVELGGGHWLFGGRGYHLGSAPNGGTYLVYWNFRQKTLSAHHALLALLLALIGGTIVVTHVVIRGLLRPLRSLGDGVERLSAGHLDVVLPEETRDEFGVLTRAFNEMVGRVREMIRARDQLLVDVSHELRSPLTRLRVATELLPEQCDRSSMTADLAEMEMMIAELLELERLRDGRGIAAVRQDLAPIIREVVGSFENRPPGVRIVSLPDEITAEIDGERIRTVVRNLIENAIKFSRPDSHVVELSAMCDTATVVLRVTDDGPGVPDEDRALIFEPFFRASRSRSKSPAGYGLGLSICKRIVEAHGGTISVRSGGGPGAVFEVTLPRRAP
ncbi:MAG: HAMP domain-containing histidine kinase [Acidobacteria bacterium]|nr:HAMP domain-containing histidine kinase [Acidobacteriota bacterium]